MAIIPRNFWVSPMGILTYKDFEIRFQEIDSTVKQIWNKWKGGDDCTSARYETRKQACYGHDSFITHCKIRNHSAIIMVCCKITYVIRSRPFICVPFDVIYKVSYFLQGIHGCDNLITLWMMDMAKRIIWHCF